MADHLAFQSTQKYPVPNLKSPNSALIHSPPVRAATPIKPNQKRNHPNLPSAHSRFNLRQTLTNPQDAINQQSIRGALNLEVAEERVGSEQTEHFVQRIVALGVGFGGEMCGERGIEGEGVGWAADSCSEGEERKVSNVRGGWRGGVRVEYAVVCLGVVSTEVDMGRWRRGGQLRMVRDWRVSIKRN